MKKLTKQQEIEKWQAIANAFYRFVQRNPPENFSTATMIMLSESGRHDGLIKLLDEFGQEHVCQCAKSGKTPCCKEHKEDFNACLTIKGLSK